MESNRASRVNPSTALTVNRVHSGISNASPVRDNSGIPQLSISDCAFCAFFTFARRMPGLTKVS